VKSFDVLRSNNWWARFRSRTSINTRH